MVDLLDPLNLFVKNVEEFNFYNICKFRLFLIKIYLVFHFLLFWFFEIN